MKPHIGREIGLLMLPVVLLGGAAWWQTRRPALPKPALQVAATKPPFSLTLKSVRATWNSPNNRAFQFSDSDCEVVATVTHSLDWLQAPPSKNPTSLWCDLRDEQGRSIKATLARRRKDPFSTTTRWGIPTVTTWIDNGTTVASSYDVSWAIPFNYLPATTKSMRLDARVGWGTARPANVQFEVLPAWMRRPARRLQIQKIVWNQDKTGSGGVVAVDLAVQSAGSLFSPGVSDAANDFQESAGVKYRSLETRLGKISKNEAKLIVSWSERVESADGRYNSLKTVARHMNRETQKRRDAARKAGSNTTSIEAGNFAPLFSVRMPPTPSNRGRVEYRINAIPKTVKNPVFRAEIFVEGDGKTSLSCPLQQASDLP